MTRYGITDNISGKQLLKDNTEEVFSTEDHAYALRVLASIRHYEGTDYVLVATETLDYSAELFSDVMTDHLDYWQLGETVCGAEDPAVILVGPEFARKRPELAQFGVCRVKERFVSAWRSDTYLEFSNRDITGEEYQAADDFIGE